MGLTPEKLQAILEGGNDTACLALFTGATEHERHDVAELAFSWSKTHAHDFTASVAALAACSLSQIKKLGWRGFPTQERAYAILADRRPVWIDDWANLVLETSPRWLPVVRRLVREGLCRRPDTDNYVLGLLDRFSATLGGRIGSIQDALLADSTLLDDVWRLFEIEGNGEFSLAACDKFTQSQWSWETALVALSRDGKLPRTRLLDASLDTLARDFAQFRAGWFSRFHEALQPTLDERAERAERYLALLASKIPPTVSFTLNALTLLDKAGRLPPAVVVTHIGPALLARSKGTVLEALKLLDRAAEREPARKIEVSHVAVEAVRHESSDVQGAVLALLERHAALTDASLVERVRAHTSDVAASQRKRLEAWLGSSDKKPAKKRPSLQTAPANDGTKQLLQRAQRLDRKIARLAGVDHAIAALEAGTSHVPAPKFTGFEIPHLRPDQAIAPITDLDELIDCFAAVLENADSPDDVERVLDGVSRLCAERPDDFARRTGPLAKRAYTLLKRRWGGAFVGTGPVPDLCGLAIAWTSGEMPKATGQRLANEANTVLKYLTQRVVAIAQRAHRAVAQPLLAAPTHGGAWIDPLVLVERIRTWPDPSLEADRFDEIQALLRLAPDHRAAALGKSAKLPGEFGAAVRHALGAKGIKVGPTAALWVAAARARDPFGDDPAVEKRHPGLGPDAGKAARLDLGVKPRGRFHDLRVAHEPAAPNSVPLEFPTVLLHGGARVANWSCAIDHWDAASVRWAGSIWPLCREPWFAAGTLLIGTNLDWWEAGWGNRTYLEPLIDADVPLLHMSTTLLVLGLAAKEPGESGLATDALIAAIDDGRLDGLKLGERMFAMLAAGLVKASRWAKTLKEAARISPLHSAVVALALQRALQSLPDPPPRDLQALLEVLKELLIAQGQALTLKETRESLGHLQASGKTAKLAREIVAFESSPAMSHSEAVARALKGRLERAERWS